LAAKDLVRMVLAKAFEGPFKILGEEAAGDGEDFERFLAWPVVLAATIT
jgi:hypothetical protein